MIPVLSIPIHLLWKVHISTRYKLALLGVFSLTLFIMAVSIARVILAIDSGPQVDDSWLYTWSAIEHAVGLLPPIPLVFQRPNIFLN